MRKPLTFTATYSRTVNLGKFNSEKLNLSVDYYVDEVDIEEAFEEIRTKVLQELGLEK